MGYCRELAMYRAGSGLEPTYTAHGDLAVLDHQRALLQQTGRLSRSWNCYATVVEARRSFKWVGNDIRRKHSRLMRKFSGKFSGSQLGTIVALPPGGVSGRAQAQRVGFGVHFQQYIYAADHRQAVADLRQYWGSMFGGSKFYTGVLALNSGSCGEVKDTDGASHNGRVWAMILQPGISHEQVAEYIDCAVIPAIKNMFGNVTFASANDSLAFPARNAAPMFASDRVLSAATYVLKAPLNITDFDRYFTSTVSNDTNALLFQGLGYGVMTLEQVDLVKNLLSARVDLISEVAYRPSFVVVDMFDGDVLRVWTKLV
jgi:hypothetical protein